MSIAVIQKGIPIPNRCKYPWLTLKVKDCFDVPGEGEGFIKQMRVQAARAGKKYKRSFITKPIEGGIRIWRKE